jgi:hypothetical protein
MHCFGMVSQVHHWLFKDQNGTWKVTVKTRIGFHGDVCNTLADLK